MKLPAVAEIVRVARVLRMQGFHDGLSVRRRVSCLTFALVLAVTAHTALNTQSSNQQFLPRLLVAAHERTTHSIRYDGAYVRIPYPNGDVPADTGVCTDEIIRIYRAVGIDLQKLVHEDMQQDRAAYPTYWRTTATTTDANIDHRRVPNLMVFFARKGKSLPITNRSKDYAPGDLVTWDLGGNVPHIGIVVETKSPQSGRYLIVHNIGRGPKMEDVLFNWKITGHYRYGGSRI
jgi:uncharacterized protein YijF (DUF1287 family)